jgi:hypothetical protein
MADNFHKIKGGLSLDPNASPTNLQDGDIYFSGTTFKLRSNGTDQPIYSPWQAIATNYSLVVGDRIFADTSAGSFTLTLPSTPALGDTIEVVDPTGSWSTNNLTISRNPLHKIDGVLSDFTAQTPNKAYKLVFYTPTSNWIILKPTASYGI